MRRTRKFRWKEGEYLMKCDLSGFTGYSSEMRKTWDGKFVLKEFWEPRNQQDFVRSRAEDQSVPNPRPQGEDVFVPAYPNQVTKDDL